MMFKYLWSKPAGGGPAPLISNPVKHWMVTLVALHLFLFVASCFTLAFPSITDMSCQMLMVNSAYCAVCGAVAFIMLFYFSVLSCQTWGTEQYWTIAAVVTLSMAFVDIVAAGWGIYVFIEATTNLYEVDHETQVGCQDWKAVSFYYCTACVIILHVVIALLCGAVSFRLAGRISSQLDEIRRLV
ncbi:UNVERIFIED_CONTAM: membrane protein, putative [Hammondia hammondi]|eukprot:XP_008889357.1 membrane protein, putative [Hammondia hammondi]